MRLWEMKFTPTFERQFFSRIAEMNAPIDDRPIDQWGEANITMGSWSPWPGRLSFDSAPYLRAPLQALGRATCHRVTIVAAAAGGKSTIGEVFLARSIAVDPGFFCWFSHIDDAAKEFAETRIWPFLENCPSVVKLLPQDRHKRRAQSIIFPHMSFLILPANISAAQSKHIRFMVCDEPWLYKPGMLAQLHKRTTKFAHNRKILELSTGSILGDETDQAFQAGTKREWQFGCVKCGVKFVPFWGPERLDMPGGVRWAKECKLENGVWDYEKVRKTAYYECPNCRERYAPTEENQYKLNRGGLYTPGPDDAAHESFHWAAWVSDFRLLSDFAVEFLQAKAAIKRGSTELLQEFKQKREAGSWDVSTLDAEPMTAVEGTYALGDDWEKTIAAIFFTVDVQKTHLWAVARNWTAQGESRLVWAGRILTWDELRKKQLELGVPDAAVFVDSGKWAEMVYGQCCRYDWNAIKGEKAPSGFVKKIDDETIWRVPAIEANGKGTPAQLPPDARNSACWLYRISEEMTAERLHLYRTGRAEGWTIPKHPPAEYAEQMSARIRKLRRHKTTGQPILEWVTIGKCGEHLWDCERYQIAAAHLAGLLDGKPEEPQTKEQETK